MNKFRLTYNNLKKNVCFRTVRTQKQTAQEFFRRVQENCTIIKDQIGRREPQSPAPRRLSTRLPQEGTHQISLIFCRVNPTIKQVRSFHSTYRNRQSQKITIVAMFYRKSRRYKRVTKTFREAKCSLEAIPNKQIGFFCTLRQK